MRVVVRAFNKDGYHKDIIMMDDRQIRMNDARCSDNIMGSCSTGLIGVGMSIDPDDFPEMVRFEIVIPMERT